MKDLQSAKMPTLGLAYVYQHLIAYNLQDTDHCLTAEIEAVRVVLLRELETRWKHPSTVMALSVMLDPRFKDLFWAIDSQKHTIKAELHNHLNVAYKEQRQKMQINELLYI